MQIKRLLLLTIVCLLFNHLKAQTGIVFKIKYLPEHSYKSTTVIDMNMEMDFSGDEKKLEELKAGGILSHTIMTNSTSTGINIQTGKVGKEDVFPLVMRYTETVSKNSVNGEETGSTTNPLHGRTVYGKCTTSGQIQIDSLSGETVNENVKTHLLATLSKMINAVHFPEKPLSIGEIFTQDVPLNLPLGGKDIQVVVKIIYKLIAVDNNIAYFDLNQSVVFDLSTQENNVGMTGKGNGNGDGKLVYNIDQKFPTTIKSNLSFDYELMFENITLKGKTNASSIYQVEITSLTN